jgi:hypothetical protein
MTKMKASDVGRFQILLFMVIVFSIDDWPNRVTSDKWTRGTSLVEPCGRNSVLLGS